MQVPCCALHPPQHSWFSLLTTSAGGGEGAGTTADVVCAGATVVTDIEVSAHDPEDGQPARTQLVTVAVFAELIVVTALVAAESLGKYARYVTTALPATTLVIETPVHDGREARSPEAICARTAVVMAEAEPERVSDPEALGV